MIYLDNAATTKPSQTAISKALEYNDYNFFNPSTLYSGGLNCAKEIRKAKESILRNLGATNHDVVFTSCGTESDNQAIFCSVKKGAYITDKGEHSAVYKTFHELKQRGNIVDFVNINNDGSVNEEHLYDMINQIKPDFVSIMHVNNETGAINDINKIAKKIKTINNKIIFHSDGVQAYGKIPYRLSNDIDLYSISAHKVNGLKGVGALIKRKNINISPLIFGGGQENGYRSGTENIFGIKVFEYAGYEHYSSLKVNYENILRLKNRFIQLLNNKYTKIISSENSSPYILTFSAIGLRGEVLMHALEQENIIVGNGSACSSKNRFSRVIEACGYNSDVLDGVVRISFSTESSEEECLKAIEIINSTVEKLKGKLN
jgi:cysteine desulfurase